MYSKKLANRARWAKDRGQITIFVVIAMAIFLLGFVGFAVDMTNLWFHRQMAQGAADAACQAGVMDLLYRTQGTNVGPKGKFPFTTFDCSGQDWSPCEYAEYNGYPASVPNQVTVSFPGTPPPGVILPPPNIAQVPLIRVDIVDTVRTYFAPLITGQPNQEVHASATCALQLAQVPIPIIVLQPWCPHSFQMSGNPCIQVVGGPIQSIQVNSDNPFAACTTNSAGCPTDTPGVACGGGGNLSIDLSQAGPDYDGSIMGVYGGPPDLADGFYGGTNGKWISPYPPISDPYATMPAPMPPPLSPTNAGPIPNVPRGTLGCPAPVGRTCVRYQPGSYTNPIEVKNEIAIFDPGLYYITGDKQPVTCSESGTGCIPGPKGNCHAALILTSNSLVRPSTETSTGDGRGGVQFYLSGSGGGRFGSVVIDNNAGSPISGAIPYFTDGGGGQNPEALCPGQAVPTGLAALPAQFNGSVLLGPCIDPFTGAAATNRGVLFFQDRNNNDPNGQPALQGGGELLIAGTMYFHHCPNSPDCDVVNDYKAFLAMGGTPGSSTRVYGNIITDQLQMSGNPLISMILDPNLLFDILKATLIQ
jgi:hypothetical protein